MRIIQTFLLIFLLLFSFGFAKKRQKNEPARPVVDTYWVLYAVQQEVISCTSEMPPYIIFESSGHYSGYTGCNRFFGSYRLTPKKLTMDYAGATKMLCFAQQEIESAFMKMLRQEAWDYKIEKDTLRISGDKGELWSFVAVDSISGIKRRIETPENKTENEQE